MQKKKFNDKKKRQLKNQFKKKKILKAEKNAKAFF